VTEQNPFQAARLAAQTDEVQETPETPETPEALPAAAAPDRSSAVPDNPFQAARLAAQSAAPSATPSDPEERGGRSTMADIGTGIVGGPVTILQGASEAVTLALDLAFDTDYSRSVSEGFQGFRERTGIQPQGIAGSVAQELVAFGVGFLPVVGWLGRARLAAQGRQAAVPARSLFARTAEEFGRSGTGRAMLAPRAGFIGTTALAAGGYEALISPDGFGTVADSLDFLPEFLRTEQASDDITGRENALRQMRNRLRRGSEAAVFSGAVDTALVGAGRVGGAVMETPVIGPGISAGLRGTAAAFRAAGDVASGLPGARSVNDFFQNWFSPTGGLNRALYEANQDRLAYNNYSNTLIRSSWNAVDEQLNKSFGALGLRGLGKRGVERAQRNIADYMSGNPRALDEYTNELRDSVDNLQGVIGRYQDELLSEIDQQLAAFKTIPQPTLGQTSGRDNLIRVREMIQKQRDLARERRELIAQGRREAADALLDAEGAQMGYLRQRFEMYTAPERFYGQLDANFMGARTFAEAAENGFSGNPTFQGAVREVLKHRDGVPVTPEQLLTLVRFPEGRELVDDAARYVLKTMGMEMLADTKLTPAQFLKNMSREQAAARGADKFLPEFSDVSVVESMFLPLESLIPKSPNLRALMGEVRDPKQLFVNTVQDIATSVSAARFTRTVANDPSMVTSGKAAYEALTRGSRPMFVDPGDFGTARDAMGAPGSVEVPVDERLRLQPLVRGRNPDRVRQDFRSPGGGGATALREGSYPMESVEQITEALRANGYAPLGDPDLSGAFMGSFGQLTGLWAPREVHAALKNSARLGQTVMAEIAASAMTAKAASQQMTVVMNPVSQMRNALGNFYFLASNGNLGRELDVLDSVRAIMANTADPGGAELLRQMSLLGVTDTALGTSQIRAWQRLGQDLNYTGRLQRWMDRNTGRVPFFGKLHQLLNRTYSDIDSAFKIGNTMSEESKFLNALARANLDQGDEAVQRAMMENGLAVRTRMEMAPEIPFSRVYAAEVTKDVMPTYPRVAGIARGADMTPFFGAFVSFASEVVRNSANTLMRGMREMAFQVSPALRAQMGEEAASLLEKGMRAQGANRVLSYLTVAHVAPAAATAASARVVGMDDAQVAATYQSLPPFMDGHALIFTGFDPEKGQVQYIDQSYVNPYAFATDGARAALRAYQEGGVLNQDMIPRIANSLWAGIASYAEPFTTESLVFERARDVLPINWVGRGGQTPSGSRIYGESESLGSQMGQSLAHVLGGFLPGYAREFTNPRQGEFASGRLVRAMYNIPGPQAQEFNIFEEAARLTTGFTPMVLDVRQSVAFNGLEYSALRSEARGLATRAIRAPDATPEQMVRRWGQYLDDVYRHQSALYADVLSARTLGLSDRDILLQLRQKANLGGNEASMILRGEFFAAGPSNDLIRDIRLETAQEGRARRTPTPPWREFQRLTRERLRQPLSPELGLESREQRYTPPAARQQAPAAGEQNPFAAARRQVQAAQPAAAPQQAPQPAPQQAPAIQPAAAPQASRAPVSPAMLGDNPMDILRNMEVAQRTGGG